MTIATMVVLHFQTRETFVTHSRQIGYLLCGCLHGYKSLSGQAPWYSASIAVTIETRISVTKAFITKSCKGYPLPTALWVGRPVPYYNTQGNP